MTSTSPFQPQLLCDSLISLDSLLFACSAATLKILHQCHCSIYTWGVFGEGCCGGGWGGEKNQEVRQSQSGWTEPFCHWNISKIGAPLKNKHLATLKSPLRSQLNSAWQSQATGLAHKTWMHTHPPFGNMSPLRNIFTWTLRLRPYTQEGFTFMYNTVHGQFSAPTLFKSWWSCQPYPCNGGI